MTLRRLGGPGMHGVGGMPLMGMGGSSPAGPYRFIGFNGTSTYINCGSDASLDDVPLGPFTLDLWVCPRDETVHALLSKTDDGTFAHGWELEMYGPAVPFWGLPARTVWMTIAALPAGNWADAITANTSWTVGEWHHVAGFYNQGVDNKIYLAINGVWCTSYRFQTAMPVGGYSTDVAYPFLIGLWTLTDPASKDWLYGYISWARVSSGDRFGLGVNFTPPARCAPPIVDGTTIELWAMDEGTGVTAAASVVTPTNDGTITDGVWQVCT